MSRIRSVAMLALLLKPSLLGLSLLGLGFSASPVHAEDELATQRAAIIARIDELLAKRWDEKSVQPAATVDDAAFIRRLYLDLVGVIPTVSQTRAFLADERPDKRARLIDRLLDSPAHATHLAGVFRNLMLPRGFDPGQLNNAVGLENWLRSQFAQNMRYDRIVSEFLVASGDGQSGPALFYTSQELKPEKLAASTARIFLGLQIQCAQCHDHPFDHWSQKDFWGYAAFFGQLERPSDDMNLVSFRVSDASSGEVTLPDTDIVIKPKFPGAKSESDSNRGTRRVQLSIWMASRSNPYLPRAAVNRIWAHLFGRGLVEPVDDLASHNPPSHPELFEELSRYFVQSGFDLQELFRILANTKAYQLSSQSETEGAATPELFATMAIKTLTPEQLYDSLSRLLSRRSVNVRGNLQVSSRLFDPQRQAFIAKMQSQTRSAVEFETGPPQALMLMNGPEITEATDPGRSALLGALEAPWFTDAQRIDVLFLAALSRTPSDQERTQFLEYVSSGGPTKDRRKALGDLFWALLNSAEFALNH